MRWIALLLLVANGIWLGWIVVFGIPAGVSPPPSLPLDAPRLVLLDEARAAQEVASPRSSAGAMAATDAVAARDGASSSSTPSPSPSTAPSAPLASPGVLPVAVCFRLGPLSSAADAQQVAERLGSLGMRVDVQAREVPDGRPDYQVYLPPLPSLDQARRQVRELQALDVEAYVMGREELQGAVSVGLFTEDSRAEARRAEVARLGYDVRIRVIERTRRIFEVQVGAPDVETLSGNMPGLQQDFPGLERAPDVCG